jgi:hypothetical protein
MLARATSELDLACAHIRSIPRVDRRSIHVPCSGATIASLTYGRNEHIETIGLLPSASPDHRIGVSIPNQAVRWGRDRHAHGLGPGTIRIGGRTAVPQISFNGAINRA